MLRDARIFLPFSLSGEPLPAVTRFVDGGEIADFAWSRDGKRLAIGRYLIANDVVLFKGIRP